MLEGHWLLRLQGWCEWNGNQGNKNGLERKGSNLLLLQQAPGLERKGGGRMLLLKEDQ
jgi:hypothetical protein